MIIPLIREIKGVCLFKRITTLPCPACGSSRAVNLLLAGDIKGSLLLNPFGLITSLLLLMIGLLFIVDTISGKKRLSTLLKADWPKWLKVTLALIIVANWGWNLSKGL